MSTVISVQDLSKSFFVTKRQGWKYAFRTHIVDTIVALKDIKLIISKGEFVALLGPNGAGKSTLIKILIGVLAQSNGSVRIIGKDPLEEHNYVMKHIGVVFGQRSRLWYDLPVKESFELTKRLYISGYPRVHLPHQKEWEEFLFESIDIVSIMDRQVKKLSLGERMRCELVNTLLYNPEIIFLDEPTIGLDVVSKQKIREALKILNKQGKTILLTSHDTGDIEQLCERVIIINHGMMVVDMSMKEFLQLSTDVEIRLKLHTSPRGLEISEGIRKVSEFEVAINCKKTEIKDRMKFLLDTFDVEDISIQSEGVDEILSEIYQKKN
ncbi:MAG: ATP-binding cassette domain-containing protein [Candidatus Roizmanbacteria bacterium]